MAIESETSNEEAILFIKNRNYDKLRDVLLSDFDINVGYNDGWALLHYAAESDDSELIEIIASDIKVDLNIRAAKTLWTPLMVSASLGNSKALMCLIEKGADASCVANDGASALMIAAKADSLECVDILLKADKESAKLQDDNGMNALMHGIHNNLIVEKLIIHSDLTQVNTCGTNVLHLAAERTLDTVKLVLKENVIDINAKDIHNKASLDYAVEMGNFDIINVLVENGAIIDYRRISSSRIYYLAIENDNSEVFIIKYMIENRFSSRLIELLVLFNRLKVLKVYAEMFSNDPKILESFTDNVIDVISKLELYRLDCLKLILPYVIKPTETMSNFLIGSIDEPKYFRIAFEHFSSISFKMEMKKNIDQLFKRAIEEKLIVVCKFLLQNGADPNRAGDVSPLIHASHNQSIVELLIKHGADVEKIDPKTECTPLFWAAFKSRDEFAKTLLKYGADPFKMDKSYGMSPIMIAIDMGRFEIFLDIIAINDKYKSVRADYFECSGASLFLFACQYGNLNIIKILVEKGAYLDEVDNNNQNCLHLALKDKTNRYDCSGKIKYLLKVLGDKCMKMFTAKDYRELSPLDLISKNSILINTVLFAKPELKKFIKIPKNITIKTAEEQEMCLICREIFVEGEEATKLPCRHLYHKNCIKQWSKTCPYCQSEYVQPSP